MLKDFIFRLSHLSSWEVLGDFHGFLAMLSLVLFGAAIVLYFSLEKIQPAMTWLRNILIALFVDLATLDMFGLFIYVPYRTKGGPRTMLLSSENTAWLHEIVFEHKEFLAFAPPLLILVACIIVINQGAKFSTRPYVKKAVLFSIFAALFLVLIVAAEAVLVTKVAPLK